MGRDELARQLAHQIVESLGLDEVDPTTLDLDAPLFVEDQGLGLDSIDALELVVVVEREHGVKLQDMETAREAFASLRTLAEFVEARRAG